VQSPKIIGGLVAGKGTSRREEGLEDDEEYGRSDGSGEVGIDEEETEGFISSGKNGNRALNELITRTIKKQVEKTIKQILTPDLLLKVA
jgi:hypothetical protein